MQAKSNRTNGKSLKVKSLTKVIPVKVPKKVFKEPKDCKGSKCNK